MYGTVEERMHALETQLARIQQELAEERARRAHVDQAVTFVAKWLLSGLQQVDSLMGQVRDAPAEKLQ
jgi:hypothetical protein